MASTETPRLGWIGEPLNDCFNEPTLTRTGLGSMGLAMATNLQRHLSQTGSPSLTYHNRTMSRGEPLRELGASPSPTINHLLANTDIIFLSLSDDTALASTLDALTSSNDAAPHLPGKIIVDTSTVHPSSSANAHERLAAHGAQFIAAPVFGASPVAAKGQLLWALAGPDDAIRAVTPFLVGVMARGVIRLGEDVTRSSLLKTAG